MNTATRIPNFPAGTVVKFDSQGQTYSGTFVRKFSPARNAGMHYEINVDGYVSRIFCQGPVGRSVRRA